ncbi:cell division protein ZapA [Pseudothioclava nitratireducens]|uniref:cell division protein ZapA n=1 Tax=Pseudothioclava nitratireducens TaxID=1928646 RepID=UPI0023DAB202|nr:cell division protein ZapA [Defluviimonas nitratireducens]MDF1620007.1 cell division protein ZapA [Defluviimonas nitratireducens]
MPEVKITIGGRTFDVACQEGEEHFLQSAAAMLDAEASTITGQIGRLPEAKMLLMAGLMLADKAASVDDENRTVKQRIAALEAELAEARANPARVEVPVIPSEISDTMAELAARAEALADTIEESA